MKTPSTPRIWLLRGLECVGAVVRSGQKGWRSAEGEGWSYASGGQNGVDPVFFPTSRIIPIHLVIGLAMADHRFDCGSSLHLLAAGPGRASTQRLTRINDLVKRWPEQIPPPGIPRPSHAMFSRLLATETESQFRPNGNPESQENSLSNPGFSQYDTAEQN